MRIENAFTLVLCGAILLAAPVPGVRAQDMPSVEANNALSLYYRDAPAAVLDRSKAVQAELSQLQDHDWAGVYYRGRGLGSHVRIMLAPAAGVTATVHGCTGLYASNEGLVEPVVGGRLKFAFKQLDSRQPPAFPDEVLPVHWGERRYLIASSELNEFVSAINLGDESRQSMRGRFLLAEGDDAKPAVGLPDLPAPYRERIRREELIVAATHVVVSLVDEQESWCSVTYRFTLAHGADQLLAPDISLRVKSPENIFERLRIVSVSEHGAVGEISFSDQTCAQTKRADKSWTFTTGAYDPAIALEHIEVMREVR